MSDQLVIDVVGTPAPQGSKRAFVVNGRAVMAESSKKVAPWRQDVVAAVLEAMARSEWTVPAHAVRVDVVYYLPRPRYHYRTGKRAHELRPDAPTYVDKKPDKDKLDRATSDALTTSGVIRDDAQIAAGSSEKRYADGPTGARITIRPLGAVPDSVAAAVSSPVPAAATVPEALL